MNALGTMLDELLGLVTDDARFTAAVIGWIALSWLLVSTVLPNRPWVAASLFGGLGAILIENVLRRSGEA